MDWNGDNYILEAERTYGQRVQAAARYLQSRVRENISVAGTAVVKKGYTNRNGRKVVKGSRIYGATRSRPGEFPRKQYGTLRQSIATDYSPETLTARVGSPMAVARYLELGTSKMRPRKLLRATLAEEKEVIRRIIELGGDDRIDVA